MKLDSRFYVLFLAVVAIGVFLMPSAWQIAVACGVLVVLCGVGRVPTRQLFRRLLKVSAFVALIVVSYGFVSLDPALDRWVVVTGDLKLNVAGWLEGLLMGARILAIVLASALVKTQDPKALADGLRRLGLPLLAAASIDVVLALFDGSARVKGRGRGNGSGDGRGNGGGSERKKRWAAAVAALRRVAKGDAGVLLEQLDRQIDRGRAYVATLGLGPQGQAQAADIAVIAGTSLTMLGIKALKLLPAIPFAPGHKLVLLTPLYIFAGLSTRSRFGATWTGLTMGVVAFLMGDGRYGVLEIVKHVVPGLIVDLVVPLLKRRERVAGTAAWVLVGGLMAVGRFATIFTLTLIVQAPSIAYAILAPGLAVHLTFGLLSGLASYHLVVRRVPLRAGPGSATAGEVSSSGRRKKAAEKHPEAA